MTAALPLLERYPALASAHPVAGLVKGPTPVEPFAGAQDVHLKRDDLTATDYGGNKIRKLDFLLADAAARGRRSVMTFGYAGSNFVAATAWHGRKLGLRTIGGLLPQVPADYVVDNLSVSLACGAELFLRESRVALVAEAAMRSTQALLRDRRLPVWIPPGGSNALGALGFVNAAMELKQQIAAGLLPAPRQIVLPFSSMGSVAGLAAGLQLAGIQARITAVQVVDAAQAGPIRLLALLEELVALLRRASVQVADAAALAAQVDVRDEFFGGEYARADAPVKDAMQRFVSATGARVDSAYSGKALACLYADLDRGRLQMPALYWHTLSKAVRPPGVGRIAADAVHPRLRKYFA